jgi:hypothetical protein
VARRISRQEYERRYGPPPADAVQAVAGNFLTETKFEEAYARLIGQSLSHEDAVRAARQQVYGKPRKPGVGPQGPENVAAINWYRRRMAGSGHPAAVPPGPTTNGALLMAGTRLPKLLAFALAGTGAAAGGWLASDGNGGQS